VAIVRIKRRLRVFLNAMSLNPARISGLFAMLAPLFVAVAFLLPTGSAADPDVNGRTGPAAASALPVEPEPAQPKPAGKPSSPYKRPGMWIWYVDASHGGNLKRIIKRARRSKIGTVYIKSGDGTNVWSQFSASMVDRLQRAGLKVCGWQYVYGRNPVGEAKVSAVAKRRGADCFVIDAETEYEGNYSGADRYIRKLRKLVGPKFRLSLSTFPYAHYHPGFPYSVFLGPGAATINLPQVYWKTIGDSVKEAIGITWTYNRMYKRGIFPVGQTYLGPRLKDLTRFQRFTASYGSAPSWWSWQETNRSEWSTLRKGPAGPYPKYRPVRTHPTTERGARGDHVVWLQQHLVGAGYEIPITGIFGKQTRRAVRQFQKSRGLSVDGRVGNQTWNRILRVRPVRVRWSGTRARGSGASASSQRGPLSAGIPPRRNELAGPGR
jgi:hypothetical protein